MIGCLYLDIIGKPNFNGDLLNAICGHEALAEALIEDNLNIPQRFYKEFEVENRVSSETKEKLNEHFAKGPKPAVSKSHVSAEKKEKLKEHLNLTNEPKPSASGSYVSAETKGKLKEHLNLTKGSKSAASGSYVSAETKEKLNEHLTKGPKSAVSESWCNKLSGTQEPNKDMAH